MDEWADGVRREIAATRKDFDAAPHAWRNDVNFFNLGCAAYYLDSVVGVRYREDQRNAVKVLYTDPSDLFVCGVMDSLQGTCASMPILHLALGWRLGWPVSLACVWAHHICRYDDGRVAYNIEATDTGFGGLSSPPDEHYVQKHKLPPVAIECGSDLCSLNPRQMLGCFVGLQGRYFQDTQQFDLAEMSYLLARSLFPNNRYLHHVEVMASVQQGANLFDRNESGHPRALAQWTREWAMLEPWTKWPPQAPRPRVPAR